MIKIAKRQFTATGLRLALSIMLFVTSLIGVALFLLASGQLRQVAIDTSHVVVDATASQNNLAVLEKLQTTLNNEQDVIQRTSNIVADSQSYQYQDQILTDLNGYANKAGISITNIDFAAAKTSPATPAAPVQAAPSGVKSTFVTITLKNPVAYDKLMRFVESIEQNLTKMQISKISLSKGSATGSDVTSDALAIEVYIR